MKAFVTLFRNLEESADHKVRMNQIIDFFRVSTEEEITSAIDFLSGNRPKKLIDISTLKDAIQQMAFLPEWLVEESYSHSGDWAEVVSLLIKPVKIDTGKNLSSMIAGVEKLRGLGSTMKMEGVFSALQSVSTDERYFLIKLFTGGTRLKIPEEMLKNCRDITSGVPQEPGDGTLLERGSLNKVKAVLLYVKYGRGANTEYSFAVKKGDGLVTLTKITSDDEYNFGNEISSFVKNNTIEKFGPVISVKPEMVFEIGFDEVRLSPRHKCGVSLVSPKIIALLRGITPEEIGSIEYISSLISN